MTAEEMTLQRRFFARSFVLRVSSRHTEKTNGQQLSSSVHCSNVLVLKLHDEMNKRDDRSCLREYARRQLADAVCPPRFYVLTAAES